LPNPAWVVSAVHSPESQRRPELLPSDKKLSSMEALEAFELASFGEEDGTMAPISAQLQFSRA
jgi:hypothetical protein